MSVPFGWDLLYKSVKEDINADTDILICFTHLLLISNGFKCVGIGESKNLDGIEEESESLPKGWNDNYALRYMHRGKLFTLKGTKRGHAVTINLINVADRKGTFIDLNTDVIKQRSDSLPSMIPEYTQLFETIKSKLINGVLKTNKSKDIACQTTPQTPDCRRDSAGRSDVLPPMSPLLEPTHQPRLQFVDPMNVGRSDLDPFGSLGQMPGGGMIFVPPQGPDYRHGPNVGVPRGSLPPGARFDPFRPPDVDRNIRRPHNPDNDEMPPPGFDDMYM